MLPVVLVNITLLIGSALTADLPAFPGAEGWGSTTPGGRGGKVIFVTNLNDSGPGSLREGLETPGPRTILFRVSGIIYLKSQLILGDSEDAEAAEALSFVTIAGQSAPGGGITVADRVFRVRGAHDVIVRHVRFRNSDNDAISAVQGARRIVIDHCSFSWGTDENVDFYRRAREITVQNCINAECLERGGHDKGSHSKGFLIGRGAHQISLHHNFISGNTTRNPQLVGNNRPDRYQDGERFPVFDFRNNILYNCRRWTLIRIGAQANVVGNVFVPGPLQSDQTPVWFANDQEGTRGYLEGNIWRGHEGLDQWEMASVGTAYLSEEQLKITKQDKVLCRADRPFTAPAVTTVPAEEVVDLVLPTVGALPRDATDRRLVREFYTGMGSCGAPDRTHDTPIPPPAEGAPPADVDNDGMPDEWEKSHGLKHTDARDGGLDRDGDGYTNLEEYLNHVAAEMERKARQQSSVLRGR